MRLTRNEAAAAVKRLRDNVGTRYDTWVYDDVLERLYAGTPARQVREHIMEQRDIMTDILARTAYLSTAMIVGRMGED